MLRNNYFGSWPTGGLGLIQDNARIVQDIRGENQVITKTLGTLREKFKEMKRIQMDDIPLIDTEANSPKYTFSEAQRSGSLHIMSNKILQEEHQKIMREFNNTKTTHHNTLFSVGKHIGQNAMPTIPIATFKSAPTRAALLLLYAKRELRSARR